MQYICIIYRLAVNFQKIVYNMPLGHAYLKSWEKKKFFYYTHSKFHPLSFESSIALSWQCTAIMQVIIFLLNKLSITWFLFILDFPVKVAMGWLGSSNNFLSRYGLI